MKKLKSAHYLYVEQLKKVERLKEARRELIAKYTELEKKYAELERQKEKVVRKRKKYYCF